MGGAPGEGARTPLSPSTLPAQPPHGRSWVIAQNKFKTVPPGLDASGSWTTLWENVLGLREATPGDKASQTKSGLQACLQASFKCVITFLSAPREGLIIITLKAQSGEVICLRSYTR